jgi:phosphoribosylformylglycinamidine synthase
LGGSLYHRLHDQPGGSVPAPVPAAIETMRALHRAMRAGLIRACHDLSEGGLAVAAAEMALAGRLGLSLDLRPLPRTPDVDGDAVALFSESGGRFLVAVAPKQAPAFEKALRGHPVARLGQVTAEQDLTITGFRGDTVVEAPIADLVRAWQGTAVV